MPTAEWPLKDPFGISDHPGSSGNGSEELLKFSDLSQIAALWAWDGKLLVVYILGGELQDFTDSHPSSGHQFQHDSVSHLRCPEDDLIDRLLFDYIPVDGFAGLVKSPQHWDIIGVQNGGIKIGPDEVEEGLEVGVAPVLGLLLSAPR